MSETRLLAENATHLPMPVWQRVDELATGPHARLVQQVNAGDAAALLAAQIVLRERPDRELLQSTLRFVDDSDELRKELAIRAAYASGHTQLIDHALALLASPDLKRRAGAVRGLGFAREPLALLPLLRLVTMGDATAPLAIWALGEIAVPHALVERVLFDAYRARFCFSEALIAIGKLGSLPALPRLVLAAHRDPVQALQAALALSLRHDLTMLPPPTRARLRSQFVLLSKKHLGSTEQVLLRALAIRLGQPI